MTAREEIADIHARLAELHARLAVLYRPPPARPAPTPSPPPEHDEPADVQSDDDGMDGRAFLDHLKTLPDFETRRRLAQSIAKSAGFGWQPWLWTAAEVAVIKGAMDAKMPATRRRGVRP